MDTNKGQEDHPEIRSVDVKPVGAKKNLNLFKRFAGINVSVFSSCTSCLCAAFHSAGLLFLHISYSTGLDEVSKIYFNT